MFCNFSCCNFTIEILHSQISPSSDREFPKNRNSNLSIQIFQFFNYDFTILDFRIHVISGFSIFQLRGRNSILSEFHNREFGNSEFSVSQNCELDFADPNFRFIHFNFPVYQLIYRSVRFFSYNVKTFRSFSCLVFQLRYCSFRFSISQFSNFPIFQFTFCRSRFSECDVQIPHLLNFNFPVFRLRFPQCQI